jgi:hypothetical protein
VTTKCRGFPEKALTLANASDDSCHCGLSPSTLLRSSPLVSRRLLSRYRSVPVAGSTSPTEKGEYFEKLSFHIPAPIQSVSTQLEKTAMKERKKSGVLPRALAATGVVTAVVTIAGFLGVQAGAAADFTLSLNYTCPFPLIGNQSLVTKITTALPDTVVVNQPTPEIPISADVTVPATATQGLNLVGATTIEGTAKANAHLDNAGFGLDISPVLTIPKTQVPADGSAFTVHATGKAPSVAFPNAGNSSITVGPYTTTLTPKKDDGTPTGLGTFDSKCTVDTGQNTTLATFVVQPDGTPPPTSAPPSSAPPSSAPPSSPPPSSAPPSSPPPGGSLNLNYSVNGSTHIQALGADVKVGPGSLKVGVDLQTGALAGDLVLPDQATSFTIFGFLPGTAKVKLLPVGQTTGTFQNNTVKSDSKETIRLTDVALFGYPLVSNSTTCQTVSPADIALISGPDFSIQNGGKLTGTYTIPALKDCGSFNDYISYFAAGPNNTISVQVAPAAAQNNTVAGTRPYQRPRV